VVATVTVHRDNDARGGLRIEISGHLNALLGERAFRMVPTGVQSW
jgi:hypothetical protein